MYLSDFLICSVVLIMFPTASRCIVFSLIVSVTVCGFNFVSKKVSSTSTFVGRLPSFIALPISGKRFIQSYNVATFMPIFFAISLSSYSLAYPLITKRASGVIHSRYLPFAILYHPFNLIQRRKHRQSCKFLSMHLYALPLLLCRHKRNRPTRLFCKRLYHHF